MGSVTSFTRILCPVDQSDTSARALGCAAALAARSGAQLTVLRVVPMFDPIMEPSALLEDEAGRLFHAPSHEEVLADLRQWIRRTETPGLPTDGTSPGAPTLLVEKGRPHLVIAERAASLPADLIVLGTHGRSGISRLMLGSVTERVLQTAPCPVLTVPPAAADANAAVAFGRILCPIDYSPSSLKALDLALDLARDAGGSLTVLHVVEYMDEEEPCEHTDFDIRRYRQAVLEQARARLHRQLAGITATGHALDEVVEVNRPYREILTRAAAASTDLIVMGAQGSGGLDLMLYGSNTQHVVRAATCPVLTVRA